MIHKFVLTIYACLIFSPANAQEDTSKNEIEKQFNISHEAYYYLEKAICLMEEGSVNRGKIDWDTFKSAVYTKAANASIPSDTYEAIRFAISLLEDHHSFFLTPEQINYLEEKDTDSCVELIQAQSALLNDQIGYLLIPPCSSLSTKALSDYALNIQQEIRKLDEDSLSKWVIDLRGNSGGNMWPMVLGLRPLIGKDIFGFFSNGSAEMYAWNYENLTVKIEDIEVCSMDVPSYQLRTSCPSIALLLDNQTASSGEATCVAFLGKNKTRTFGQKTGGFTSANEEIRLADGAAIFLSTTYLVDRLGIIYKHGITPDELIPDEGNSVLNRAIQWLENEK